MCCQTHAYSSSLVIIEDCMYYLSLVEDYFGSIKCAFTQRVVTRTAFCWGSRYRSLFHSSHFWRVAPWKISVTKKSVVCESLSNVAVAKTFKKPHTGMRLMGLLLFLGVGVEDPGVAGLPQPNAEPHHRIRPAGRLPALCLLCDWRKVSGICHVDAPFFLRLWKRPFGTSLLVQNIFTFLFILQSVHFIFDSSGFEE